MGERALDSLVGAESFVGRQQRLQKDDSCRIDDRPMIRRTDFCLACLGTEGWSEAIGYRVERRMAMGTKVQPHRLRSYEAHVRFELGKQLEMGCK